MATTRQVGPLWCHEVIALLGDYLDAELSAEQTANVELHLAGCPECTRFGGEFGAVVNALAAQRPSQPPLSPGLVQRLEAALRRAGVLTS